MDSTEQQIEKSKKALWYLVERIRWDESLRYRLGYGTEAFERVTDAAASLFEQPVAKVREYALGLDVRDSQAGPTDQQPGAKEQRGAA